MAIRKKRLPSLSNTARTSHKTKNCLVSIITVCRNSEKTIAKTIESVLEQSYSHLEYIIIDGASTDRHRTLSDSMNLNSEVVCDGYLNTTRGIYDAMNKGISLSPGELIGILNAMIGTKSDAVANLLFLCIIKIIIQSSMAL